MEVTGTLLCKTAIARPRARCATAQSRKKMHSIAWCNKVHFPENGYLRLDSLYTIVRFYGIDPRVFFYHERELDDPARSEFHALVDTCTKEETLTLIPIVRTILEALRRKGSITLEDNT